MGEHSRALWDVTVLPSLHQQYGQELCFIETYISFMGALIRQLIYGTQAFKSD